MRPARRAGATRAATMGKAAVLAACGAVAIVLFAPTAGAQTYETGMVVSATRVTPGAEVTVHATGLRANAEVEIRFDDVPVSTVRSDANGVARDAVTIPQQADGGQHLITMETSGAPRGDARESSSRPGGGSLPGGSTRFARSVDVLTGTYAFSNPDGGGTSAILLVALLLVVVGGFVAVVRHLRPTRA